MITTFPPVSTAAAATVPSYKGPWSSSGTYAIGDTVVYNGALWRATAASSAQSTFPTGSFTSDLASGAGAGYVTNQSSVLANTSWTNAWTTVTIAVGKGLTWLQISIGSSPTQGFIGWPGESATTTMGFSTYNSTSCMFSPKSDTDQSNAISVYDQSNQSLVAFIRKMWYDKTTGNLTFDWSVNSTNQLNGNTLVKWRGF